jgi:CspA family cold shock protein
MGQETRGTVKRIVEERGFGFIEAAGGVDYFFHRSACQNFAELRVGDRVTFTIGRGNKGPRAETVTVTN